jgi:hypothetical protein
MAKQWSSADRKPEKLQSYYQKKFRRMGRYPEEEYWK